MDRNKKLVKKLSGIKQEKIIFTIKKILAGQTNNLDVKKLVGHQDLFRAQIASEMIVFISNRHENTILEISRRSDTTYGNYKTGINLSRSKAQASRNAGVNFSGVSFISVSRLLISYQTTAANSSGSKLITISPGTTTLKMAL